MNTTASSSPSELNLLCAGAAQGLVKALEQRFKLESGTAIRGRYGAVGAMREALAAGEPCDVMITTDAIAASLQREGALDAALRAPLGMVRTGVAVRIGDPLPDISSPEALASALREASAWYCPDPERATAGIHFVGVLERLDLADLRGDKLRAFPNGATAMRELAEHGEARALGCTQITEIVATPGLDLAGPLPDACGLATVYSAAIAANAASPELARRFIELLTAETVADLRSQCGFE